MQVHNNLGDYYMRRERKLVTINKMKVTLQ